MNRGIEVGPRSYAEIEKAAARTRRSLLPELGVVDAIDPMHLFERALRAHGMALTKGTPVLPAVRDLPEQIEAYTEFDAKDGFYVVLSEETYARIEKLDPRGMFTLVHELGHLGMHRPQLCRLTQMPQRELMLERGHSNHKPYCDSEWQADAFAAAFVMPAPALDLAESEGWLTERGLQAAFNSSYKSAQIRINRFTERRRQLLPAWT